MFGNSNSPTKESHESNIPSHPAAKTPAGPGSIPDSVNLNAVNEFVDDARNSTSSTRKSQDEGIADGGKKRRSSGIAKAGALFSSAKNSFHLSGSPNSTSQDGPMAPQPSAIQKLGKTDAALSVPQGSLNNSAGESRPGPRSTFRVGVTEDKNKKCRRTMEDTHAYLYNFLSTPAPNIGSDTDSTSSSSKKSQLSNLESTTSLSQSASNGSHVVETDNGYFAIFDGHAGTFAADWCGKKLHVLLEDMIRRNPNTPVPELLDQTFTNVDQQLDKLPLKNSGCTAICAVLRWEDRIPNSQSATGSTAMAPAAAAAVKAATDTNDSKSDNQQLPNTPSKNNVPGFASITPIPKLQNSATRQRVLYTANVGDARIVLCRNGKALRLSYDHKGSDENEGKRISNAGGLILNNRVNGVLAVTRALGDAYMKDLVTGHPYTTETVIQPDVDEFLLLACDGVSPLIPTSWQKADRDAQLWDVCSDQEAVDLVRNTHDPQAASKQLVDHALARFSTDNLSCMVVRFDNKAVQQTVEHKAEPIGVDGDPPTRPGGISEADAIVKEARRSMGDGPGRVLHSDVKPEEGLEEDKARISQEIIREEEEKEVGPELDPEGLKHVPEMQKSS